MIKLFAIIFLLFSTASLEAASSEAKIIKLIFSSIFHGQQVEIFADTDTKKTIVLEAGFTLAPLCSKADIVYASSLVKNCVKKPIFTDNYSLFRDNSNVIGAFYWSKGRPNIMFNSYRMKYFHLELPESLQKYNTSDIQ